MAGYEAKIVPESFKLGGMFARPPLYGAENPKTESKEVSVGDVENASSSMMSDDTKSPLSGAFFTGDKQLFSMKNG